MTSNDGSVGVVDVEAPSANGGTVEKRSPAMAAREAPIDGVTMGNVAAPEWVRRFQHLPKARAGH